jgi:hypothetical protein
MRSILINKKLFPLYWILLSLLVIYVDYITGPTIQFPIFFILPVALSSWYNGRLFGIFIGLSLSILSIYLVFLWDLNWSILEIVSNIVIRIFVLFFFAYLIDRVAKQKQQLTKEIKVLKGILPICSFCKKIRNANNEWEFLETYIKERSEADFSHGLCPDCAKKHYSEFLKEDK